MRRSFHKVDKWFIYREQLNFPKHYEFGRIRVQEPMIPNLNASFNQFHKQFSPPKRHWNDDRKMQDIFNDRDDIT